MMKNFVSKLLPLLFFSTKNLIFIFSEELSFQKVGGAKCIQIL